MNDLQIEYFLAVAENLSFTKTASEKYISQPAISKQIAVMEEELGVVLFERGYKTTKLTEAGKLYADFYKKYREDFLLISQQAKNVQTDNRIPLRIGFGSGWTLSDFLPRIIQNLKINHPHIKIFLESHSFRQLSVALNENNLDIIITLDIDIPALPQFSRQHLTSVPRYILYSPFHPLSEHTNIQPQDFINEPFLIPVPEETSFIMDLIKSYCRPYGFMPKIQLVKNVDSLLTSVLNGLGVAIVDGWTLNTVSDKFLYLPIHSHHDISAVWVGNSNNSAIPIFLQELSEVFCAENDLSR